MTREELILAVRAHRIKSADPIPMLLQHIRIGAPMWRCPCGRTDGPRDPHETEICPEAMERALLSLNDGLTHDEIDQGLRNLDIDPTCGACMSIFYTGMTLSLHTCPGTHPELIVTQGSD